MKRTISEVNFGTGRLDRSISKPLMEKRRRDRINKSLDELKTILVTALKRDQSGCSKLEKADILEMTVNYLKTSKTSIESKRQYEAGKQSAIEESVKMIQSNPALTQEQKTNLILQIRGQSSPPAPRTPPQAVLFQQQQQLYAHLMQQQLIQQQKLLSLSQQRENSPPKRQKLDSDSEESGFGEANSSSSSTSSDNGIFRPW